jgi:hypothetical protein
MSILGAVHSLFGLAALALGTAVMLRRKGTSSHRRLGWAHVTAWSGCSRPPSSSTSTASLGASPLSRARGRRGRDAARWRAPDVATPPAGGLAGPSLPLHGLLLCRTRRRDRGGDRGAPTGRAAGPGRLPGLRGGLRCRCTAHSPERAANDRALRRRGAAPALATSSLTPFESVGARAQRSKAAR